VTPLLLSCPRSDCVIPDTLIVFVTYLLTYFALYGMALSVEILEEEYIFSCDIVFTRDLYCVMFALICVCNSLKTELRTLLIYNVQFMPVIGYWSLSVRKHSTDWALSSIDYEPR